MFARAVPACARAIDCHPPVRRGCVDRLRLVGVQGAGGSSCEGGLRAAASEVTDTLLGVDLLEGVLQTLRVKVELRDHLLQIGQLREGAAATPTSDEWRRGRVSDGAYGHTPCVHTFICSASLFRMPYIRIQLVYLCEESLEAGVRRVDGGDGRHQLHSLVRHVLVLETRRKEAERREGNNEWHQQTTLRPVCLSSRPQWRSLTFLAACRFSFCRSS